MGFYSTPAAAAVDVRSGISQCGPGQYCDDGVALLCAGGTYSTSFGRSSACTDACLPGYFCPNGTGTLTAVNHCGSRSFYCPEGSVAPVNTSSGFYALATAEGLYFGQAECEAGYFCVSGLRSSCPSGRYGNTLSQTSSMCTGNCSAGYFCPAGSTLQTQFPCGSVAVYCPSVSAVLLL